MPVEVEPPELARLLDFAERPRVDDWSLRAALVRYAQPEPERVGTILELVRRIEWALKSEAAALADRGHEVWAALDSPAAAGGADRVVELLRAAAELDRLGDILAVWAVEAGDERPDAEVDAVTGDVARRLDALGVAQEQRERPPRRRG